jgi:hypothetical protein
LNTAIANAVTATNDRAQYDEQAKRLLAEKHILAHILVKTVDEFRGMKPREAVKYIEGEPYVSVVPVEPGLTNTAGESAAGQRIVGLNTENSEINEGIVRFDIIFYVRMKDGLSQIIVNVEAQRKNPSEYMLLNRAIFYVCRMVSSQKQRDFENTNYDDIKRVVSIWICMNMKENSMAFYHLAKDNMLGNQLWSGKEDMLSIIMLGLSNEIPEHEEAYELHRLLGTLLSERLAPNEKLKIFETEYDIPIKEKFRKDVSTMCNLSEGIVEETKVKIIMNMYRKGYSMEEIADIVDVSEETVATVTKENELVPV